LENDDIQQDISLKHENNLAYFSDLMKVDQVINNFSLFILQLEKQAKVELKENYKKIIINNYHAFDKLEQS
jgi:hypothetical protein